MENNYFSQMPRDIRKSIINKILDFSTFQDIKKIYDDVYYYIAFMLKISDQYDKNETNKRIEFLLKMDFDILRLNLRRYIITQYDFPFIETPGSQHGYYKKSDKLRIINFKCDFIHSAFVCEFTSIVNGKKYYWRHCIIWDDQNHPGVKTVILQPSTNVGGLTFMVLNHQSNYPTNTIFNLENSDMWINVKKNYFELKE